jgi:hypothetical protein
MSINPRYIFTRYYKGPGTEPLDNTNNERLIWQYEQGWAENEEERSDDHPRMQEYVSDVLPLFNEDDGIPMSLKALLYNRYTHWLGGYALEDDVRKFREFLYSHHRPDLLNT